MASAPLLGGTGAPRGPLARHSPAARREAAHAAQAHLRQAVCAALAHVDDLKLRFNCCGTGVEKVLLALGPQMRCQLAGLQWSYAKLGGPLYLKLLGTCTKLRSLKIHMWYQDYNQVPTVLQLTALSALSALESLAIDKRPPFQQALPAQQAAVTVPVTPQALSALSAAWPRLRKLHLGLARADFAPGALEQLAGFTRLEALTLHSYDASWADGPCSMPLDVASLPPSLVKLNLLHIDLRAAGRAGSGGGASTSCGAPPLAASPSGALAAAPSLGLGRRLPLLGGAGPSAALPPAPSLSRRSPLMGAGASAALPPTSSINMAKKTGLGRPLKSSVFASMQAPPHAAGPSAPQPPAAATAPAPAHAHVRGGACCGSGGGRATVSAFARPSAALAAAAAAAPAPAAYCAGAAPAAPLITHNSSNKYTPYAQIWNSTNAELLEAFPEAHLAACASGPGAEALASLTSAAASGVAPALAGSGAFAGLGAFAAAAAAGPSGSAAAPKKALAASPFAAAAVAASQAITSGGALPAPQLSIVAPPPAAAVAPAPAPAPVLTQQPSLGFLSGLLPQMSCPAVLSKQFSFGRNKQRKTAASSGGAPQPPAALPGRHRGVSAGGAAGAPAAERRAGPGLPNLQQLTLKHCSLESISLADLITKPEELRVLLLHELAGLRPRDVSLLPLLTSLKRLSVISPKDDAWLGLSPLRQLAPLAGLRHLDWVPSERALPGKLRGDEVQTLLNLGHLHVLTLPAALGKSDHLAALSERLAATCQLRLMAPAYCEHAGAGKTSKIQRLLSAASDLFDRATGAIVSRGEALNEP